MVKEERGTPRVLARRERVLGFAPGESAVSQRFRTPLAREDFLDSAFMERPESETALARADLLIATRWLIPCEVVLWGAGEDDPVFM
jgi:hypothetical protein